MKEKLCLFSLKHHFLSEQDKLSKESVNVRAESPNQWKFEESEFSQNEKEKKNG